MASFSFVGKSGTTQVTWDDPAIWAGGTVPNAADADVVLPVITQTSKGSQVPYTPTVTIGAGKSFAVNTLDMLTPANAYPNEMQSLAVAGSFFAKAVNHIIATDSGLIALGTAANARVTVTGGVLTADAVQHLVIIGSTTGSNTATVGTIDSLDSASGGLALTATGIKAVTAITGTSDAVLTVAVTGGPGSFGGSSGSTLTSGTYAANGGTINLDIGALIDTINTNVTLGEIRTRDPATSAYVPIYNSVKTIAPNGTLLVVPSSNTFANPLQVAGTINIQQRAALTTSQLTLTPTGHLNGDGTITASIVNNGTITANVTQLGLDLGPVYDTLDLKGAVTGSGTLVVGPGIRKANSYAESDKYGAVLRLDAANSETVLFSDSTGSLVLGDPAEFAGSITPATAVYTFTTGLSGYYQTFRYNSIALPGIQFGAVTGYSYAGSSTNGVLTITEGATSQSLAFNGDFTTASFSLMAVPQALSSIPSTLSVQIDPRITSVTASKGAGSTSTGTMGNPTTGGTTTEPTSAGTTGSTTNGSTTTGSASTGTTGNTTSGTGATGTATTAATRQTLYLDGGTTRTGGAVGADVVLGTGATTVYSDGPDTVYGGSGAATVVATSNAIVVGGAGHVTFVNGIGTSTVFSGTGGLTYTGGPGYDIVVGYGNPVTAQGGSGGGIYFGGGNSTITAGAGAQAVMVGTSGDRLFSAGSAGDLFGVSSGAGNVLMSGVASTGNDVFFGAAGTGPLTFITGSGDDILGLGQGTNLVTLGAGHSTVFGNTGTTSVSTITAGTGSADIGFGGSAADFVIPAAEAARTFTLFNFAAGPDHIRLSGYGADTVATALATQSIANGVTSLTLGNRTVIALIGVSRVDATFFQ